jgi:hypothetical protein
MFSFTKASFFPLTIIYNGQLVKEIITSWTILSFREATQTVAAAAAAAVKPNKGTFVAQEKELKNTIFPHQRKKTFRGEKSNN